MTKRLQGALAALLLTLPSCGGGGGSNPTPVVTPTPAPTPTATPTPTSGLPAGMVCDPTPPPLYGITVKVHLDSGALRKTLDSRPRVINIDGYCGKAGFGTSDKFCWTRPEGDPQAEACDYLAVGRASDTGRWGPTWFWESKACTAGSRRDWLCQPPGQPVPGEHPRRRHVRSVRGGRHPAVAGPRSARHALRRCTIVNSGSCQ